MPIQCNEINQTINYLLQAFDNCTRINPEDLRRLVELVAAVNICANGGANYNTLNSEIYEPNTDEVISFEPNTFHSLSLVVLSGSVIYDNQTLNTGTTINPEFTTLNQQEFSFIVKSGSKVLVNYITETIE